jgi:hypothetical protein
MFQRLGFRKYSPDLNVHRHFLRRSRRYFRELKSPWDLREPFWKAKYGQVELTVFSSGVVVADTPHITAALESLNSFLAMASFLHLFCVPANRWDLGVNYHFRTWCSSRLGRTTLGRASATLAKENCD